MCVCMYMCSRARVCVCVHVRACVRARARVCVCVCVRGYGVYFQVLYHTKLYKGTMDESIVCPVALLPSTGPLAKTDVLVSSVLVVSEYACVLCLTSHTGRSKH